jgi:galactitol-specific phosphotransferase system IIB component
VSQHITTHAQTILDSTVPTFITVPTQEPEGTIPQSRRKIYGKRVQLVYQPLLNTIQQEPVTKSQKISSNQTVTSHKTNTDNTNCTSSTTDITTYTRQLAETFQNKLNELNNKIIENNKQIQREVQQKIDTLHNNID